MKKLMPQPMIIPSAHGIFPIQEDIRKYLVKIPRQNIEIVFFGSDPWSIHVLKAMEDNFDIKAVVCAPDSPTANYFRGPVLTPDKLDSEFIDELRTMNPELLVVASYGKIIPKSILDIPKYGALNVHPSLLPKYRGPSPVPATILAGDKITGITIIKMDEKMDHGPIVFTKKIRLSGKEDFPILINKLFQVGAEILVKIIPDFISGKIKHVEQNHQKATYCPLLKKESGYFDISNPPSPEILDRMIRAYYPWPGVWTHFRQGSSGQARIVKFLPASSHPELDSGSTPFLVQMEGKKPLPLKDFLNGYPEFPLKF